MKKISDLAGYILLLISIFYIAILYGEVFILETFYIVNGKSSPAKIIDIQKDDDMFQYSLLTESGKIYKSVKTDVSHSIGDKMTVRLVKIGSCKIAFWGKFVVFGYAVMLLFFLFCCIVTFISVKKIFCG